MSQQRVKCPECGHEVPITPNMKIPPHLANCQRCGEPIPELKQYIVEEQKEEPKDPKVETE